MKTRKCRRSVTAGMSTSRFLACSVLFTAACTLAGAQQASRTAAGLPQNIKVVNFGECVSGACFAPDGKRILLVGAEPSGLYTLDKKLIVALEPAQQGSSKALSVACFSPDGKLIVAELRDKTLVVFSATGQKIRELTPHESGVLGMAISRDGQFMVTSAFKTMRLWKAGGEPIRDIPAYLVNDVAISANGSIVAGFSQDEHAVKLWNADGTPLATFTGNEKWSGDGIDFSPDGKLIVYGGPKNSVLISPLAGGDTLTLLSGQAEPISAVAFSPDGRYVASGSDNGVLKVWSVQGELLREIKPEGKLSSVGVVAWSPDGAIIATAGGGCW